jgi:hypothetical protein
MVRPNSRHADGLNVSTAPVLSFESRTNTPAGPAAASRQKPPGCSRKRSISARR